LSGNKISGGTISSSTLSGGAISGGSINIGNGKFTVSTGGVLSATGASISGTLTANANSYIGPWHVTSDRIELYTDDLIEEGGT